MTAIRRSARTEEGAAAVEFALLSIILFTLIFGIIEFGQFYSQYQVFQGAAREGARVAAVRGADGLGPSTSEVTDRVDDASDPYTRNGAITITPSCSSTTTGDPITVKWTQDFDISMPFVPAIDKEVEIKGVFRCE